MIVLFIIFAIAAILAFIYARRGDPKDSTLSNGIGIGSAIVAVFFFIMSTFYIIDPGEIGIEVIFGEIVDQAENGIHAKNPFASVVKFDVKTQKEDHNKTEGTSQDLQLIIVDCTVQYRIDYTKIKDLYSKVGEDYSTKIIEPAIKDAVKASTALFKVEQIVVERAKLKKVIEDALKEKLSRFYLELQDFQITDIDFSKEFNKVVEEKQLEEQKVKTAEYRRQQAEKEKYLRKVK
jgi:regulator of protease activity HflC (stomatin/prohibitin superfamily)